MSSDVPLATSALPPSLDGSELLHQSAANHPDKEYRRPMAQAEDKAGHSRLLSTYPLKKILRRPTERFPEDLDPAREGVALHKDKLKG